jgi:cytochrome c oxidase subunit 4
MAHDKDVYHITPFATYVKVFIALVVLTVITVLVSHLPLGGFHTLAAYGIATVKALLVMAYFMHLKFDSMTNRVVVASCLFFLLLLFAICFIDIATRMRVESTF